MNAETKKPTPPPRRKREGARYETCRECGQEWNVSKQTEIPPRGYICPHCMGRYK